jgi:tetratricopeptide (TPR) repeat protein
VAAAARARGIVLAVLPPALGGDASDWELVTRRGSMHDDETPDFFVADLIDELAVASYRLALSLQKNGRPDEAAIRFNDAWRMNWLFPELPVFLGYMSAVDGRWAEAENDGALADGLFKRKLKLADEYRGLPELKASIRRQAADSATQHGVALEKLGRRDEAAASYRRAIALTPTAQAYYDLAVLAWGHDWSAAQEDLSEAVRLDPNHADARRYLELLRRRASGSR